MGGGEQKSESSQQQQGGQEQYQESNPWAPFGALITQPGGFAEQLGNQVGTPSQAYGGQTFAGMSDQERQGLEQMQQMAGPGGQLGQLTGQATNAWQQMMDPSAFMNAPGAYNPLDMYSKQVGRGIDQNVLDINQGATASGQGQSSSRAGLMEGLARGRGAEAISDYGANLTSNLYNQGMQARGQAIGMTPMMMQQQLGSANLMRDVGGAYQGYEQKGIDEDIRRHEFGQNEPWQRLQAAAPMLYQGAGLGGTGYGYGSNYGSSQGTQTDTSSKSPFSTIMPLAMMAGGAFMGGPAGAGLGYSLGSSMGG